MTNITKAATNMQKQKYHKHRWIKTLPPTKWDILSLIHQDQFCLRKWNSNLLNWNHTVQGLCNFHLNLYMKVSVTSEIFLIICKHKDHTDNSLFIFTWSFFYRRKSYKSHYYSKEREIYTTSRYLSLPPKKTNPKHYNSTKSDNV